MEHVRFINIATFGDSAAAHLARNELEAAGIQAQVTGDVAVETLWYVGSALGGVKLMVAEKDGPAAVATLIESGILDADHELPDDETESGNKHPAPKNPQLPKTEEEWESLTNRIWRASIIGFFFCPLWLHLYSLSLLAFNLDAFQHVPQRQRWKLWAALIINLSVIMLVGILMWAVLFAP